METKRLPDGIRHRTNPLQLFRYSNCCWSDRATDGVRSRIFNRTGKTALEMSSNRSMSKSTGPRTGARLLSGLILLFAFLYSNQAQSATAAIDGGANHSILLKTDGTVWAWGGNSDGQLGDGTIADSTTPVQTQSLTSVSAVSPGDAHNAAANPLLHGARPPHPPDECRIGSRKRRRWNDCDMSSCAMRPLSHVIVPIIERSSRPKVVGLPLKLSLALSAGYLLAQNADSIIETVNVDSSGLFSIPNQLACWCASNNKRQRKTGLGGGRHEETLRNAFGVCSCCDA